MQEEKGELNYGRTNEIVEDVEVGRRRINRLSPEEERGRSGKAAIVSAILTGGASEEVERNGSVQTGARPTVADILNPSDDMSL